jgi:hypothetical protein
MRTGLTAPMTLRVMIGISAGLALSSCTYVPSHFDVPYSNSGVPLANSIVERIRCELAELVRDDIEPRYNRRETLLQFDYHTAMLLSLDANDTASAAPSLAFPYTGFSFGITPSAKLSRQDQINYSLNYSMLDLYFDWKANPQNYICPDSNTNLAGNLGIREKVSSALNISDLAFVTAATPTDGQFSGVINFTATKSIDQAGPTWTLAHFTGPGAFLAASEVNTDKLAFGFAAGAEIKILPKKRPTVARIPVAGKAEQALGRALTNDLGTQLNAIRNNQR